MVNNKKNQNDDKYCNKENKKLNENIKKKPKLRILYDDKKKEKIEFVLKKKKLDSLKQKLNEYSAEKIIEKYNDIKLREKIERKNTKRDFFGLDKEKPKILITCQDESEINNLNTSNVNNEFNNDEEIICDINKNSNNENKIKNELNLDNEINNNNKAKNKPKNENEELKNYETMEEEEKIEDEIEEDDDEEDEEEEEEEEEEENDDDDETLSELRSFDSLETLSKKENESTIFENRAEDLINTSSKQKKDYTIIKQNPQKNDVVDINKSQTNKSKTSSKPNEYIKIDTTLTQVYIYFCKKANISINDIYSQFIIDNLTKSQINEFLNRSIKKPCEPQYEHRIKNGFTIPISNQNEVIVNKGTSGFKKRLTYKPNMKILNSKERAKKIKLLQEIRVRFINCLLSYGDCLQYMKQLQKDNKELVLNKKSNEISLNQKIGKLINEIEYITNDIDDYQSHKKLRQEKIETQYNKFSKIIEKSMIELDIVYYKKKKEYEDLLIELEQLKQFEEKVNTHPELLLKEIEILHNKINENDENYKNELKRMQFREKNKLKEMDDKKQQNINYLILESYNHVSPKLIQAYLDRVENNKRLHYESRIQKEFQENLKKEIDRLKKENENIKKSNTKKINTYNKISSTEKYKIKCPPNEIYKFESIDSSERKKMTKKQILLSKIHDLKALSPIKKENNTLEHVAISPSNLALIDEVTQVLNFTKSNILLYNKNNKEIREKLFHKNITGFYTYINGKNTDSSYNKSQTSIDISNK